MALENESKMAFITDHDLFGYKMISFNLKNQGQPIND